MSARSYQPHHPESVQACVSAAIKRLAYRIGLAETGRLVGVDESTVRRRLQDGTVYVWPVADQIELKKRERDELGTRDLHEAETRALYGSPAGEAIAAVGDVVRDMGLHAQIVALQSRILEEGIDVRDVEAFNELEIKVREAHVADLRMLESIRAKIFPSGAH